jgi:hypothetical protein
MVRWVTKISYLAVTTLGGILYLTIGRDWGG